ncbi:MAG: ABC transporter ATP-binding protein [Lachnospiraceae bacterium]|nr:ABC transporter ATP-binding protein [Lachnospiraceae bacterium]RKI84217.1 ABC transporter ATP-binding protein [bacterium 1xD42-87]
MSKENSNSRVGILKKLGYIFDGRDKKKLVFLTGAIVVGSFLELLAVMVFMPFIDVLQNRETIQTKWYLKKMYDLLGLHRAEDFMVILAICIIMVYLVKNVYLIVEKDYIFRFSYNTQMKLSTRLLAAYMKEPYTFHLNHNIAVLQRSLYEDTSRFMQVILYALELGAELAVAAVMVIYLLVISKTITIIVLGLLAVFVGGFLLISRKYSRRFGLENQGYEGKIFQWMNQSLGGIKEIKILERETYFTDEFRKYWGKYARGLRIARTISILPKYTVEAVSMTGLLIAVIVKLVFGEADMTYFISQLAAFAVAAMRLMPSVGRINEHASNMLYAFPSVELVYHDLVEIEGLIDNDRRDCGRDWKLQKEICVQDVSYHYPDTEEWVLKDVNFTIKKGTTVAFIGSTGSGKTTMVDIILGLLTPVKGAVMADEINIHEQPKTFHAQVGYIPQTIYLSDDTIRNNIAFGVQEGQIDEDAVNAALEKAQLRDFVESLPHGLETIVGDRGVRLSGGQRQRIGIARALYHDPEILVLDEATSALDNETEAAVMEAIEHLQGMKTMIIIAHRLTTIRNVDVIYEVGDGEVVERSKDEVFVEV